MHRPGTIEALAEVIANTTLGVSPVRAVPTVPVKRATLRFDDITREACLRRIRFLAKAFDLQWIVEQTTFNRVGIDALEDNELASLLTELERARECAREGIPLDDAGFVRDMSAHLP